jgi:tetratricopeptide (TPR) repeat protein
MDKLKENTMNKIIFTVIILIYSFHAYPQRNTLDSLYKLGIRLHDEGKYEIAIQVYNQALKISPDEPELYYEISFSYISLKQYEQAIIYADKVLNNTKADSITKIHAVITKGSALDYTGRTNESIVLFENYIKRYGGHYLIYFNLGVDYHGLKEYKKAEECYTNAILLKSNHPGSHYMLGELKYNENRKFQSMLCYYYFLILEPDTERSKKAIELLTNIHDSYFKRNKEEKSTTIFMNPDSGSDEFSKLDFFLAIHKVLDQKKADSLNIKSDNFIFKSKSFINYLNSVYKDKLSEKISGIWKDLYIEFFSELNNSGYIDVYCNLISISIDENAVNWLNEESSKLENFAEWLEKKGCIKD